MDDRQDVNIAIDHRLFRPPRPLVRSWIVAAARATTIIQDRQLSRVTEEAGTRSDRPAAEKAAVGAVVPGDVLVALEPAPQHGYAVALPRPVQQQRGDSLDVGTGRA